jgi:methyl-accepting chemotaxis protein
LAVDIAAPEQKSEILAAMVRTYAPVYTLVSVTDAAGLVGGSSDASLLGRNESGEEWFKSAMRGDVYYSPEVLKPAGGASPTVVFSAPLRDRASSRLMGVVASWVNWGTLFDEGLAKKERFGETGELLLLDAKQSRLLAAGRGSLDALPEALVRRISSATSGRGVAAYEHPQTGRRYLAGWATEGGFGTYAGQKLVAVAQQEEREALASVTVLLRQFVVLGLVAALAIAGAGAWLARRDSRPLVEMAQAAERVSRGEVQVEIVASSSDELGAAADAFRLMTRQLAEMAGIAGRIAQGQFTGQLEPRSERDAMGQAFVQMLAYLREMAEVTGRIAEGDLRGELRPRGEGDALGHAIQRMAANLKGMIARLREASDQVAQTSSAIAGGADDSARSAETAASAVEEMTSTMHEMGANIQNVSRSVSGQAASVTQTSASTQQMVRSIQRIAAIAAKLNDMARRSSEAVSGGRSTMVKASDGIRDIRTAVDNGAGLIQALGLRAESIGKIVGVISDIATQTNLLALNAAIEAARAGEHGVGFAVVADEVRKLAERSARSTSEIGQLIQGIQREVQTAVEQMQRSGQVVVEGAARSEEVDRALQRIDEAVQQVAGLAREIDVTTGEQSAGSEQIGQAIAKLNETTQEIASAMEQQSSGADQVVRAAERMKDLVQQSTSGSTRLASSAQELASQAEALREMVGRFQLDSLPAAPAAARGLGAPPPPVTLVPRRAAGAAKA